MKENVPWKFSFHLSTGLSQPALVYMIYTEVYMVGQDYTAKPSVSPGY